ncbi:hypothetical protein BDN70DRAFT_939344 [Pholiota conissans]|uniref:Uncharacterized protein n=1 Tax=Pholiota conissans TaxID=109636 RepID=A0A9P6CSC1_9AGAR|nr:hypothetical protein BDN70DRAFT_939344 [Pholiota conissans]
MSQIRVKTLGPKGALPASILAIVWQLGQQDTIPLPSLAIGTHAQLSVTTSLATHFSAAHFSLRRHYVAYHYTSIILADGEALLFFHSQSRPESSPPSHLRNPHACVITLTAMQNLPALETQPAAILYRPAIKLQFNLCFKYRTLSLIPQNSAL